MPLFLLLLISLGSLLFSEAKQKSNGSRREERWGCCCQCVLYDRGINLKEKSVICKCAFLCVILRQNHFLISYFLTGTLHKPTIKAEPGSVITSGSSMDIWCQGTLDAEIYVLHKEGSQKPWGTQTPEKPENKAKVSIPSVTYVDAGQYRCYCYSSDGWSEL